MLKAILFDLDNTLIDWGEFFGQWEVVETPHIERVYDYLGTLSQPCADVQTFKQAYFDRTQIAWDRASETLQAPHIGRVLIEAAANVGISAEKIDMRACLEAYGWGTVDAVKVFPEVTEILPLLRDRGILLGMITNGYAPMWMRDFELAHYGLLEYFTACRFSSADEGVLKPHPDLFTKALDCLGTTAQETVFVGDSLSADVAGAQGVGMRAVHRARTSSEAYYDPVDVTPDATIENLRELLPVLDKWFPGWNEQ